MADTTSTNETKSNSAAAVQLALSKSGGNKVVIPFYNRIDAKNDDLLVQKAKLEAQKKAGATTPVYIDTGKTKTVDMFQTSYTKEKTDKNDVIVDTKKEIAEELGKLQQVITESDAETQLEVHRLAKLIVKERIEEMMEKALEETGIYEYIEEQKKKQKNGSSLSGGKTGIKFLDSIGGYVNRVVSSVNDTIDRTIEKATKAVDKVTGIIDQVDGVLEAIKSVDDVFKNKAAIPGNEPDENHSHGQAPNGKWYSNNDWNYLKNLHPDWKDEDIIYALNQSDRYKAGKIDAGSVADENHSHGQAPNNKYYSNNDWDYLKKLYPNWTDNQIKATLDADKKYKKYSTTESDEDAWKARDDAGKAEDKYHNHGKASNGKYFSDNDYDYLKKQHPNWSDESIKYVLNRDKKYAKKGESYTDELKVKNDAGDKSDDFHTHGKAENGKYFADNDYDYLKKQHPDWTDQQIKYQLNMDSKYAKNGQGYLEVEAGKLLPSKYEDKYHTHGKAPNGKYYANNDWDYVKNNNPNYTDDQIKAILNEDEKYAKVPTEEELKKLKEAADKAFNAFKQKLINAHDIYVRLKNITEDEEKKGKLFDYNAYQAAIKQEGTFSQYKSLSDFFSSIDTTLPAAYKAYLEAWQKWSKANKVYQYSKKGSSDDAATATGDEVLAGDIVIPDDLKAKVRAIIRAFRYIEITDSETFFKAVLEVEKILIDFFKQQREKILQEEQNEQDGTNDLPKGVILNTSSDNSANKSYFTVDDIIKMADKQDIFGYNSSTDSVFNTSESSSSSPFGGNVITDAISKNKTLSVLWKAIQKVSQNSSNDSGSIIDDRAILTSRVYSQDLKTLSAQTSVNALVDGLKNAFAKTNNKNKTKSKDEAMQAIADKINSTGATFPSSKSNKSTSNTTNDKNKKTTAKDVEKTVSPLLKKIENTTGSKMEDQVNDKAKASASGYEKVYNKVKEIKEAQEKNVKQYEEALKKYEDDVETYQEAFTTKMASSILPYVNIDIDGLGKLLGNVSTILGMLKGSKKKNGSSDSKNTSKDSSSSKSSSKDSKNSKSSSKNNSNSSAKKK